MGRFFDECGIPRTKKPQWKLVCCPSNRKGDRCCISDQPSEWFLCFFVLFDPEGTKEKEIRNQFYVFGEIRSIRMAPKQSCAFVTFVKREVAEQAAKNTHKILKINGNKVHVTWGRPQVNKEKEAANAMASGSAAPQQDTYRPYYPSMDPSAQGNAPLQGERPDERSIPKWRNCGILADTRSVRAMPMRKRECFQQQLTFLILFDHLFRVDWKMKAVGQLECFSRDVTCRNPASPNAQLWGDATDAWRAANQNGLVVLSSGLRSTSVFCFFSGTERGQNWRVWETEARGFSFWFDRRDWLLISFELWFRGSYSWPFSLACIFFRFLRRLCCFAALPHVTFVDQPDRADRYIRTYLLCWRPTQVLLIFAGLFASHSRP